MDENTDYHTKCVLVKNWDAWDRAYGQTGQISGIPEIHNGLLAPYHNCITIIVTTHAGLLIVVRGTGKLLPSKSHFLVFCSPSLKLHVTVSNSPHCPLSMNCKNNSANKAFHFYSFQCPNSFSIPCSEFYK